MPPHTSPTTSSDTPNDIDDEDASDTPNDIDDDDEDDTDEDDTDEDDEDEDEDTVADDTQVRGTRVVPVSMQHKKKFCGFFMVVAWSFSLSLFAVLVFGLLVLPSKQHQAYDHDGPWQIHVLKTEDPLQLSKTLPQIEQPVLSLHHTASVRDYPATFYADPFVLQRDHKVYLFYELKWAKSRWGPFWNGKGIIGYSWRWRQETTFTFGNAVLQEPFHLSYPYVFQHNDMCYMIPESNACQEVRLYRSHAFPEAWQLDTVLLRGKPFVDTSLVVWADRYYLITMDKTRPDEVLVYGSDQLTGPYQEHPSSPYRSHTSRTRNAGRILVDQGKMYRPVQDLSIPGVYGKRVLRVEITCLTPTCYTEAAETAVWLEGSGQKGRWHEHKMHHIDAQRDLTDDTTWLIAVDGQ
jgi:hypothetical protein